MIRTTLVRGYVMFADMAGFSRAMEAAVTNGGAARDVLARMETTRRKIDGFVIEHDGHVIKHIGDTTIATFKCAADALAAAWLVSRVGYRDSRRFQVAVGVAGGDLHIEGVAFAPVDVWGLPVNRAAKLGEDIAKAGEVLIDSHAASVGALGPAMPFVYQIGGAERTAYRMERPHA